MSLPLSNGPVGLNPGLAFVLDDEEQIGALVCKVLQACGVASEQFTEPAPFFARLRKSQPEFVVLDLSLGQTDAVEIIHRLEAANFQGKVLLISGRDESTLNEMTRIGERHGLAMLPPLRKPFRPADVKQRLTSLVTETAQSKPAAAPAPANPPTNFTIRLDEALRNDWLELWYQPKIDLKSLTVCGAEGLIRGHHPIYGLLTPESLLPKAGDPDFQSLTTFVVERAAVDWARFAAQGILLKLAVNAPVSAIHAPAFVAQLRATLPRDPRFPGLIVEITEDEIIRDSDRAREVATQLKLYNVDLSIDDFGTGYASLSRLNDLPFVEIKVDRSIVSGCATNSLRYNLCQTAVDLAHRFGAIACGEGVETVDDLRALIAMQCDTAQGFLFAKPMPAAQLSATLLAGTDGAVRTLLATPAATSEPKARIA